MKCSLIVKSPVHIYSGEDYTPAEYCNSKRNFKQNDEKETSTIERIDVSKYYTSLPSDRKKQLLEQLMSKNFKLDDFIAPDVAHKYSQYYIGGSNNNYTNIKEHIRTLNKTYIPGSSIKGAIEIAIINNYFEEYNYENIKFLTKTVYNLPKSRGNNIFRFLRVSDTNTVDNTENSIEPIVIFKASNDKQITYHNIRRTNIAEYIETISKGTKLNFSINNKIDDKILEKLDLSSKKDYINLENILENLHDFADKQIKAELEYINKNNNANNDQIRQQMNKFKEFYIELSDENTVERPLLRIGSGGGFLNKTIALNIKQKSYEYFSFINSLKHDKKTRLKIYFYEFPKTRRVTSKGIPLGWTQLKINKE